MGIFHFNKEGLFTDLKNDYGDYFGQYSAKEVLNEAVVSQSNTPRSSYDVFLSHSSDDARIVLGIKRELEKRGKTVYVDWIDDAQLDRSKVTKETAKLLRERMKKCKSLIYVYTQNARESKWMPWELGYFDGYRGKVAVLPVLDSVTDTFKGVEFVGLYPVVKYNSTFTGLEVRESEYYSEDMNNWVI